MNLYHSSTDLASAEGLFGIHVDKGPSGESECHWSAQAPFPAAKWLRSLSGASYRAVPETHVSLLNSTTALHTWAKYKNSKHAIYECELLMPVSDLTSMVSIFKRDTYNIFAFFVSSTLTKFPPELLTFLKLKIKFHNYSEKKLINNM